MFYLNWPSIYHNPMKTVIFYTNQFQYMQYVIIELHILISLSFLHMTDVVLNYLYSLYHHFYTASSRPRHSSVLVLVMTWVTSHTARHDCLTPLLSTSCYYSRPVDPATLFVRGSIRHQTWTGLCLVFSLLISAAFSISTLEYYSTDIEIDNKKNCLLMSGGQDTNHSASFQSDEGTPAPSKRSRILKRMCVEILLMRSMGVAVCWSVMSPKQPKSGTVGTGELGVLFYLFIYLFPRPFTGNSVRVCVRACTCACVCVFIYPHK